MDPVALLCPIHISHCRASPRPAFQVAGVTPLTLCSRFEKRLLAAQWCFWVMIRFFAIEISLTLSAIGDFSLTLVPLKPNRRLHALFFIVVGNWVVCGRGLSYCFFIQVLDIFSQKKLTISKLFDAAMMFASGLAFILRANVFV